MWQTFEAPTADALWGKLLTAFKSIPPSQESRIGDTREILHAGICLTDPRQRWMACRHPALNPAFALAEVIWIVNGRRDAGFLSYFNRQLHKFSGNSSELHGAYGHRLRHHFGLDQLSRAYDVLNKNPDSRQVVLQIWDPTLDLPTNLGAPRNPDIPCNTQSYLKVRDGKLEWMQVMRSNDVFLGIPHNIIQFTTIQEVIAGWLNVDLGSYNHLSDSLHIYEQDWRKLSTLEIIMPPQPDSLALPKKESDLVFSKLESLIEAIIKPENNGDTLRLEFRKQRLPTPYRNIACILVAEGLRRRQQTSEAMDIMTICTNNYYKTLWKNWIDRISNVPTNQ